MRRRNFFLRLVASLLVSLPVVSVSAAQMATFKGLHTFTGGSDGAGPASPLAFDRAGNLYGTTGGGGSGTGCSGGCGTVFELIPSTPRWKERVLYSLSSVIDPIGPLVLDTKGNVYGASIVGGGPCNCGEVYQLVRTSKGWTQNILHTFVGGTSDGQYAQSGLVQDSVGNLYGATESGGFNGNNGVVYELSPNGDGTWTYSIIYEFGVVGGDADNPYGPLTIDAAGNLYGTTANGGLYGWGAAFKLTRSSTSWTETVLYNFTLDFGSPPQPDGVVLDSAGNLYGTTISDGEFSLGTVYKLTPTIGFWNRTVLHTFTGASDGAYPYGGVVVGPTGALYGTADSGGIYGYGTVYKLVQGGNGHWTETVLHSFKKTDGANPFAGVVLDQLGNLYGVAGNGGAYGSGVAFEITP
jgi:uncharacterized repeat protein (TIGR03803 family)